MKNKFLLLLFISAYPFINQAQMIESKSYALMLKGLLSHSVDEVSAEEASAKKDTVIFIDSRERKEYEVSHIKNSVWVGYNKLDLTRLKKVNKDTQIVVYCSVGYRSEKVAEKLKAKGYKNVSNLYGGIFEWKNQNLPIVNMKNEPTDSVHAYNRVWGIWLNNGEKVY